ncbi:unnamed protein product [Cunninghamella blakesleeana]
MNTAPSKRELQQFLKRFVPQQQQQQQLSSKLNLTTTQESINNNNNNVNNNSSNSSSNIDGSIAPGLQSPKDYVSNLLAPTYHNQIALTKVQGPFDKQEWKTVGETLYKLQKLGLTSIVVADNPSWQKLHKQTMITTQKERIMMMVRESMALIEAIEKAGGRARLIYGDVLEYNYEQQSLDVNLDFIHFALSNDQIPIIIPALSDSIHHHQQHEEIQKSINANDTMIALTNKLTKSSFHQKLTPSKIVVINHEGGIPNHEHSGDTVHSLVNVQEEYDVIVNAFHQNGPSWEKKHPNALENLTMIRGCLAQLPQTTSSAIIVPTSSLPSALIANLVTDKPLYSSSLPIENTMAIKKVNQLRTTVFRHGIKIQNYTQLSDLNLDRLTTLLESSFQKKLDTDGYYKRLESILAGAIIAGDYEGAVIMTNENVHHQPPIYYLDKFAIAPTSQGIGLTDILWKKMCDSYPELLWRSRKDNGVNKWYFERSNGYLRLKDSNWVLFWHGKNGYQLVEQYAKIAKGIPASFV